MSRKGTLNIDILMGFIILNVGLILVSLWAIGESLNLPYLSAVGRWGVGIFVILMEIIRVIIKGGFK